MSWNLQALTNCCVTCCVDTPKGLRVVMTNPKDSAFAVPLKRYASAVSGNSRQKEFSIESPHKPLLLAQPRWRQVSHMITRHFSSHNNTRCPVHTATRDLCSCMLDSRPPSQSGEGKTQPFPIPTSPSKREDMHWLA